MYHHLCKNIKNVIKILLNLKQYVYITIFHLKDVKKKLQKFKHAGDAIQALD